MTHVKIGETLIPAAVGGRNGDRSWDGRDMKEIRCELTYQEAAALFTDDLEWSVVYQAPSYPDPETGEIITPEPEEYDNSEYSVAGPITDNRDGTVTIKMGKLTDGEALAELLEVLNG